MQSDRRQLAGVLVNSGMAVTSLGVARCFGRHGIPVICLNSEQHSIAQYSRYVSRCLKCPSLKDETAYVNMLLDFGKQIQSKMIILPTGDRDVLVLSKYKEKLEQFYLIPVPSHEIVQKFVNKKNFYKYIHAMEIPHPRTYFPTNITELGEMGRQIAYPYIVKPADSLFFQEEFHRKCFVINSCQELDWAVDQLRDMNLEIMIQEIVPGNEIYDFYTYLNRESLPLAICGWDKLRQFPPDFGTGSLCKSIWRPNIVEPTIRMLQAIGYYGFANPELIKDPRDGIYKLLEINVRITLQNRLAAACGVDIEYTAYLDAIGHHVLNQFVSRSNILWVDDFLDLVSRLILLRRKEGGISRVIKSLKARKVHSVVAWDDPLPTIARAVYLFRGALRRLFRNRFTIAITL